MYVYNIFLYVYGEHIIHDILYHVFSLYIYIIYVCVQYKCAYYIHHLLRFHGDLAGYVHQ